MKIKLCDGVIDTSKIKRLRKKPIKLLSGLRDKIKPKYSIEFLDGTFKVINKQEYKLLSKEMERVKKLYELPENQNIKLYIDDQVVIFGHIDGMYSYCWLEGSKDKIVHIHACAEFEKYEDGYKFVKLGD